MASYSKPNSLVICCCSFSLFEYFRFNLTIYLFFYSVLSFVVKDLKVVWCSVLEKMVLRYPKHHVKVN